MSPHIHFHSDCSFFAGCENMLVNFSYSEKLAKHAELGFSYRYSVRYQEGLNSRINKDMPIYPLQLVDYNAVFNKSKSRFFRMIFKVLGFLLLFRLWFLFCNIIVMRSFFRSIKHVDILHVNNGGYPGANSCMAAVFAARLCGIKRIIYVVNNVAVDYQRPTRWLDYPLDRLVVRCVDQFVTGSAFAGKVLAKVLRLPQAKIRSIHNGVRLREPSESRVQFTQRLALPDDRWLIGVVAILEERKGHAVLLGALGLLNRRVEKMPLLLIEGAGPERSRLVEYVEHYGLKEDVLFVGEEDNVFNILNSVDLVILPSIRNEDFPNVVIESMGLGKTVVASRLCGTPEQIDHRVNGMLVSPSDADELADAIEELMGNTELVGRLGRSANEKFLKEFTAEVSVGRYIQLYDELLAG